MNFEEQIPAFFEYLKSNYNEKTKKTLNPISEFSDFLNDRLTEGSLPRDFDDFMDEDFRREAKEHVKCLQEYVKGKGFKWIDCSSPSRWIFNYQDDYETYTPSEETSNVPSEVDIILNKNITNIKPDELDILRDHVEKLKSQSSEIKKVRQREIANCSYIIANLTFQQSKTVKNANDWCEAGDWYTGIDNEKAYECYKKSSQQYSILLMYTESAQTLDKAIGLTEDYKLLLKSNDEIKIDNLKKDLLDCQVQYDRAGLNDLASEKFVYLSNIKMTEKPYYIKPFYYLFKVSSKYGECPSRVLFTAFIILVFSTILYTTFGIKSGVDPLTQVPILEKGFWTSLYFSLVTFTTLGYGDYAPLGWIRVVATLQAISGLILTSLFMVTLVRKHSR
jgi:hypothetical protein